MAPDGAERLARLEDELELVLLDLDGAALPGIGFDAICRRLRTEDGSTPTPATRKPSCSR